MRQSFWNFWWARPRWQQALMGAFAVLAVLVIVGGLLDSNSEERASSTTETVTVTETLPAASEAETAEAVETDTVVVQSGTSVKPKTAPVVPDVTGVRLDVAESKLDDLGIAYEVIGGGTFGVVVPSNWLVCDQSPGIGSHARSVKLIVDRPGECGGSALAAGSGSADRLPDVRGLRLDVAEDKLEDLGIVYEEIGGGLFGIIDTSNWEVCDQDPDPGSTSQRVKLIVERPGEC